MTQLFASTPVGVPGPVDPIPIAQKDIDGKPTARRSADIGAERTIGSRIPRHLVTHAALVCERFVDWALCDDDESGVPVVEELQPAELRGEAGATRALPFLVRKPHVVVDDQLRFAFEDIG